MISVIKDMVRDRGYKADASTAEGRERMGPYKGQENDLVILIAKEFIDNHRLGVHTNILTKLDISNLTADYYQSVQEDIMEFAIILIILPNTLDISIFEDDIAQHGITVFTNAELMFNPTHSNLVSKHYLASDIELREMEEKGIKHCDLPKIYAEDCMCKWCGFKRGSVVRIEREYCDEVYYRVVI